MRTYILLALLGICLISWAQNPEEINPQTEGFQSENIYAGFPGENNWSIVKSNLAIEETSSSYSPSDNFAPQQIISVPQGWSGISSFIIPDNPGIESLFKPVMDKFVIVYNQNGMFYPDQNINTLVNWNPQSGYIAKFNQPASMGLSGQVNANRTIILNPGWNLIPVLSNCPVNVADFFQNVDIVVVKDVATYKLYWPEMGINTLNELLPGKAYYILMSASRPYIVDFDATLGGVNSGQYLGTGFTPNPTDGQLNSNAWASTGMSDGNSDFGGTYTTGDFALGASPGNVTGGGFYGFTVATGNNVFGIQPTSNDWTPGTIILRIKNNTGTTLRSLNIAYKIWVFNDMARSNSFNFSYSADNVQYTPVTSLDYASPFAATGAVWESVDRSTVLENLGIANGDYFYLRWSGNDISGSGSRDEFGIDDILISADGVQLFPEPKYFPAPGVITFPDCTVPAWQCGEPYVDPRDNRIYNTVQISTQCWMSQNLNFGNRVNGNQSQQNNSLPEKYCYNNQEANCNIYGGLYQWNEMMQYTQESGSQGLCPDGWYIPNEEEWNGLANYLGGNTIAGGALKTTTAGFWSQPNTGALNSVGFNGMPGGQRETSGIFSNQTYFGNFWTSSNPNTTSAIRTQLSYNNAQLLMTSVDKSNGFSIRCLKKEPLTINPDTLSISHLAGNYSVELTSFTTWTVEENIPWLSISPMSGINNAILTITVNENTSVTPRSGQFNITSYGQTLIKNVIVDQEGTPPVISVIPSSQNVTSQSGTAEFMVQSNTSWTVEENVDWLTVTPMNSEYNSLLSVEYDENPLALQRTGEIVIIASGGEPVAQITMIQEAALPSIQVTPVNQTVAYIGGMTSFDILSNTSWTIDENADWLTVSPINGLYNSNIDILFDTNFYATSRNAEVILTASGGSPFVSITISQEGAPPLIYVNPTTQNVDFQAGSVEFIINSNTSWDISENVEWLTVSPLSGNHDGVVTLNYSENLSIIQRVGEITVIAEGGSPEVSLILSQQASPPTLSVTPLNHNIPNTSGTIFFMVSSNTSWTVSENEPWLTVTPYGGSNDDTLMIDYLANSDFSPRSGEITIVASGGTPFVNVTIEQDSKICAPSFQDNRDGKTYNTILIGNQCWMAENLNVGIITADTLNQSDNGFIEKYCNNNSEDQCSIYGGLYQWNEMMEYSNGFGVKGICPEGWRLPEAAEWDELIQSLGGEMIAGGKMKTAGTVEAGTGLWFAPNIGATNSSGFSLLPAGYLYGDESITGIGLAAILWSSDFQTGSPRSYAVSYDFEDIFSWDADANSGFSVRCIMSDSADLYTQITPTHYQFSAEADSANFAVFANATWQVIEYSDWLTVNPPSGNGIGQFNIYCDTNLATASRTAIVSLNSGNSLIEIQIFQREFVPTLSVSPDSFTLPGSAVNATIDVQSNTAWSIGNNTEWITVTPIEGNGNVILNMNLEANTGEDIRIGYFTITATGGFPVITVYVNQDVGFQCGELLNDSRDGNVYNTVQIGAQCWMAENLNIGMRINGSSNQSNNASIEKYCYANSESNCNVYGGLYQWNEMMQYSTTPGVQGICPQGWHLPSEGEWTTLTSYLSSQPAWICGGNTSFNAKALASVSGWYESGNTCAVGRNQSSNNATGFTGLPGGFRDIDGSLIGKSEFSVWWSSSQYDFSSSWLYYLYYDYYDIGGYGNHQSYGLSVRCLKDETTSSLLEVTPSNQDVTSQAGTTTFNISSNTSWAVTEEVSWLSVSPINGSNNGSMTVTYDANTESIPRVGEITISASGGNPVVVVTVSQAGWSCGNSLTDSRDGKSYSTVQIGEQCWMGQNLNVGTRIDGVNNQSNDGNIEKYCYNNDEANCNVYGGLYQWNEMMQYSTTPEVMSICPTGWHLPTDPEWTTLSTYLGGESVAGGKMKEEGSIHWLPPNPGATNSSGFNGIPSGGSYTDGSFLFMGGYTRWWSSSQLESGYAFRRSIYYGYSILHRTNDTKVNGYSVRCLKD